MPVYRLLVLALLAGWLAGCSSGEKQAPALGEAFVGPATLKLRQDLGLKSAETATVKHGERLEIVQRRRRFVKVRTAQGALGWTEVRQLLAAADMDRLNRLAERAAGLLSQGAAAVFEPLNVHTEPNRLAPSFYQIREAETVEVVAQQLAPRGPFEPRDVVPLLAAPQKTKPVKKKRGEEPKIPPPPRPAPPPLPGNWLELSQNPVPPTPPPVEAPKPTPMDDWSLVRLRNGRAGWVLTRQLKMNIPDEVAQYSEGHRITSYFSAGEVADGTETKHNWLWTTIAKGQEPYQFDSFRYFVWNKRRHRYETAYVERNLKGYYPVQMQTVKVKGENMPGFSLIVEGPDGQRYRRTYIYQTYIVRLIGKALWQPPPESLSPQTASPAKTGPAPVESWTARLKRTLAEWKRRVLGK